MKKAEASEPVRIAFREALAAWFRIGLLSFGGPAGQIALMHRVMVEEKKWISECRFLHALNFCMVLPGPEAQQLATYIGWMLHGVRGGVAAGILFILAGALIILAFSCMVVLFGELDVIQGLFLGLKAAVLAIVFQAVARMARRACTGRLKALLGTGAFIALLLFGVPFPVVVVTAGVLGYVLAARKSPVETDDVDSFHAHPLETRRTLGAAVCCLLMWGATIIGLITMFGSGHVYAQLSLFFSKMAMVSFGGAYAVLSYAAQEAVDGYKWLLPGEMIDGLALAETTPGPLILVVQHIGFLAAYRNAAGTTDLFSGLLGALITTWVTFLPSFLWIFAGAPFMERIRANQRLAGAMSGIAAAVVGVMAHLAVWFGIHSLFTAHHPIALVGHEIMSPRLESLDVGMALLTLFAFLLVFRTQLGVLCILLLCALPGIAWHMWVRV